MLAPRSVSSVTPPVHLACSGHRSSVRSSSVIRVVVNPGLACNLPRETTSGRLARVEAGSTGGPGRARKPYRLSKQPPANQDCLAQKNHVLVGQGLFAQIGGCSMIALVAMDRLRLELDRRIYPLRIRQGGLQGSELLTKLARHVNLKLGFVPSNSKTELFQRYAAAHAQLEGLFASTNVFLKSVSAAELRVRRMGYCRRCGEKQDSRKRRLAANISAPAANAWSNCPGVAIRPRS